MNDSGSSTEMRARFSPSLLIILSLPPFFASLGKHKHGGKERYIMLTIMRDFVKYITNHVINHIPSFIVRHSWYRLLLGWHIQSKAFIFTGLEVQSPDIRGSGKKVFIGKHTLINYGCRFHTGGGIVIGENVSISPGTWLVSGTHDINDPNFAVLFKPIVIGNYVWIGVRATILCGVT